MTDTSQKKKKEPGPSGNFTGLSHDFKYGSSPIYLQHLRLLDEDVTQYEQLEVCPATEWLDPSR